MPFARRLVRLGIALPLAGLVVNACDGGNVAPPTTGALQVTTVTSGAQPDPDGYSIQIDAGAATPIGNAEIRTFTDLGSGDHAVQLGGLAANCTADGLTKSATVTAGTTATVTFSVTCAGTTASIGVTIATTGTALDPDGYSLSLDGGAGQVIGINASRTLSSVSPGNHSVALTGVPSNCTIAEANPHQVTVSAGGQALVSFTVTCPAASGRIAFATLLELGIFLANPDGTNLTRLVDGSRPIWSPDGQKVLYSAGNQLNVINADGSGQVNLAAISRGGATFYEWSPDGRMIAFCTQSNPPDDPKGLVDELWLIQADGTGRTLLASGAYQVSWSPDGRKLVYGGFVVNSDGSGLARLIDESLIVSGAVWSPDGTQIALHAGTDIYLINPDGSGLINLTMGAGFDYEPAWSPDGSRIAFVTRQGNGDDVAVMNRDGSGFSILTNSPDAEFEPDWSPDGRHIVFTRAGDSREVFVMNSDGSNQTNVSNNPQVWTGQPDWSPTR